jgi:uncharacterized membrane protein YraQ (UPF0718 family)
MTRAAAHAAPEIRSAGRPSPPVLPLWVVAAAFWAAVAAVVLARAAGAADNEVIGTFGVIFTSIVVEALPFILIGAAASAAIAVFVPARAFTRLAALPAPVQVPAAALAGFAMPVCECGSVPVARRLIMRGVHPSAGIAFMLAAPILNPIVLASTWVAYGAAGKALEMTAARAALGLLVAITAGLLIGRHGDSVMRAAGGPQDEHDHRRGSMGAFAEHLASDFLFMGRFLVLGAAVAALLQTAVPQDWLSSVAHQEVIGALALMGMAVALSLCSEADAFVAVSFTAFPLGSQLAFLVLGPVVDAKLAVLYGATFRRRFVLRLLAVAAPIALAGALIFDAVVG